MLKKILFGVAGLLTTIPLFSSAQTGDVPPPDMDNGMYCPNITQNLKFRDRDSRTVPQGQVTELQLFLVDYFELNADDTVTGFFGPTTLRNVQRFQRDQNLIPPAGYVGPMTRAKIAQVCGRGGESGATPNTSPASDPQSAIPINSISVDSSNNIRFVFDRIASACLQMKDSQGNYFSLTSSQFPYSCANSTLFSGYQTDLTIPQSAFTRPIVIGQYYQVCNFDTRGNSYAACSNQVLVTSSSQPSITVTAPNGGEQWEIGALNTITWRPYGYNPDVNTPNQMVVYLVGEYGAKIGRILDQGKASLHTYFNIDNYQTWAKPGRYFVEAVNTVTGARDRSDAPFTLLPRAVDIKVNESDGPVTLSDNQPVIVSYTTTGALASCTLTGLRMAPNGQPQTIPIGIAAINGTVSGYAYAPTPGSSTAIYATCYKTDGSSRGDSVQVNMGGSSAASVQILSPNGGEQVAFGQPYNIQWRQAGLKSVSIALYSNDQWKQWIVKDFSTQSPNDSYIYQWTPSETDANVSRFKIYITGQRADGTGYVDDKSDMPFSFIRSNAAPTTISLSAPTTGSSFSVGTVFPFTWNVTNAPAKSQVEFEVQRVPTENPNGPALELWRWQSPELAVGSSGGTHLSNVWDPGTPGYPVSTGPFPAGTYRVYAFVLTCNPQGCQYPRLAGGMSQQLASLNSAPPTFMMTAPTPSCSITSDKSSYTLGENITFSWTSTNATYAAFVPDTSGKDNLTVPGDKLPANGSQVISASVLGNPFVTLAVYGLDGSKGTCTKTVSVAEGSAPGPQRNAMSCSSPSPSRSGLGAGALACYGLWDFGGEFGNDQNMCPPGSYSAAQTGCLVSTSACQSGSATASRVLDVYAPWHQSSGPALASDADVATIASNLQSSTAAVRSQIIRIWEYTCATPDSEFGGGQAGAAKESNQYANALSALEGALKALLSTIK